MIIVRAPLRISFIGGGSDLPDFYHHSPGRVISATINRYVYAAINPTPLMNNITARYSIVESVKSVHELKNDRIRETLLLLGIKEFMEFGAFADLPIGTGLGGSSSFTVALIKGLTAHLGKRIDKKEIAEMACKIEIQFIREPIGKQDQYAATFGGFNTFQFNSDETVEVEPVFLDYKKRLDLEKHILMFFTGITRQASSVLYEQRSNVSKKMEVLKSMTELVNEFRDKLLKGDFEALGKLLHKNWLKKKKLASKISNQIIDQLYESGMLAGAWGGKVLGAGGGGCILFMVPIDKKEKIRKILEIKAKKQNLSDFKEIPVQFVQSGVEVVSNSLYT